MVSYPMLRVVGTTRLALGAESWQSKVGVANPNVPRHLSMTANNVTSIMGTIEN